MRIHEFVAEGEEGGGQQIFQDEGEESVEPLSNKTICHHFSKLGPGGSLKTPPLEPWYTINIHLC